jgi:hypothetical protein
LRPLWQTADPYGNSEGQFLDGFSNHIKGLTLAGKQSVVYHPGTADADINYALRFAGPVKGPCHKGVILNGISKHHNLAQAIAP